MQLPFKILWLGLTVLSPSSAFAAFTLDQTFELVAKKSESLQQSQLEIDRQQAAAAVIKTRNEPRLKLTSDFSRTYSQTGNAGVKGDWEPSVHTEIRHPLYEGGGIDAQLQSVDYLTDAARWDLAASKEDLYRKTAQLFYQIVGTEQDIANLRESESVYRERIKTLQDRVRIGRSRQAELLAATTQLAAMDAQIRAAYATRDAAQRRLASLTGLPAPIALHDQLNLASLQAQPGSDKVQPSVAAAQARLALAESRIAEARAVQGPRLDLFAAHDWRYPFPDEKRVQRLSFGLGLTWTLYDAGEVEANVKSALIARNQADLIQAQAIRETQLARDQAAEAYRDGLEQIRLYEKALAAAEKNVKVQQQEFENGLLTNLEIMQALDTRLQIKRNRDQAIYQAKLAYIEAELQRRGVPKAAD